MALLIEGDPTVLIAKGTCGIEDIDPPRILHMVGPSGKAIIDFSGDAVAYSGDLPVEESARIFFEAVFLQFLAKEK